jgi:hypothetical protein
MYFVKPVNFANKPSRYNEFLKKYSIDDLLGRLDYRRDNYIVLDRNQLLPISSNPNNLKRTAKIKDPLFPTMTLKIISDVLRRERLAKRCYLIYFGYIYDGGILVINPDNLEPVNRIYEPFVNISGYNGKLYERINEKNKRKLEWYEERGFNRDEIETIKVLTPEEVEEQKEIARENRKILRNNCKRFFLEIIRKNPDSKIFLFPPPTSFEYKSVISALKYCSKKLNTDCLENNLFYKELRSEITPYALNFNSHLNHVVHQISKKDLRIRKDYYFHKPNFEFSFPPNFDSESNSYNPLIDESGKFTIDIENSYITDRERWEHALKKIKDFSLKRNINILKEDLYCFEPIESLLIREMQKVGEVKPFIKPIREYDISDIPINKRFSATELAAPCDLSSMENCFRVEIYDKEDEKNIFFGTLYHHLIFYEPKEISENRPYINHRILEIGGMNLIPRDLYTERNMTCKIEYRGEEIHLSAMADALFECEGKIVIVEVKNSQPLPELYKRRHALQMNVEKIILERQGFEVEEKGIIYYVKGYPSDFSEGTPKSSVRPRYPTFTDELEGDLYFRIIDRKKLITKIIKSPEEGIKELRRREEIANCWHLDHPYFEEKLNAIYIKAKNYTN